MDRTEVVLIARIDEYRCDGTRSCLPACNYNALLTVPGEQVPMVDIWSCTGCGTCTTVCPNQAISLQPSVT